MKNTLLDFYGLQEGENILYATKAHPFRRTLSLAWLYLASIVIFAMGQIITIQLSGVFDSITTIATIIASLLAILGTIALNSMYEKTINYITNRRIIRFHAHTPFATSIRNLTWDQVVKIKTFPSNFIYKMMKIGSVVAHASSTIAAADDGTAYNTVSDDDITISDVYFYKDLGNYIEKIIYIFKNNPSELSSVRPFVLKSKGKRY